jgi:hypothetical protein
MIVRSYIVLFVLPILAFLALARTMDEHTRPGRWRKPYSSMQPSYVSAQPS